MEKITERIILDRFKEVHGSTYDYSKVNFTRVNDYVTIICRYHGEFLMRPKAHYDDKRGCPSCKTSNKSGFNKNEWYYESKYIYLIEVVTAAERFVKIGVTIEELSARFIKGQIPYTYRELFRQKVDGEKAGELEKKIKKKYPKYKPLKKFRGDSECLQYIYKNKILEELSLTCKKASY